VERVGVVGSLAVGNPIRRGYQEQALGGENATDLRHHPFLLGDVLDHLEGDDGIETAGLEA
jgi:hypothetical protein